MHAAGSPLIRCNDAEIPQSDLGFDPGVWKFRHGTSQPGDGFGLLGLHLGQECLHGRSLYRARDRASFAGILRTTLCLESTCGADGRGTTAMMHHPDIFSSCPS
jgi:hypothetical protein